MKFKRGEAADGRKHYAAEGENYRYYVYRAPDAPGYWTVEILPLVSVGTIDPIKVADTKRVLYRTGIDFADAKEVAADWEREH